MFQILKAGRLIPLWDEGYLPSVIVKFTADNITTTFGFYIHIGTYQTYDYAGTAAALYITATKVVAEQVITKATEAIEEGSARGKNQRTREGTELSRQSLEPLPQTRLLGSYNKSPYTSSASRFGNSLPKATGGHDESERKVRLNWSVQSRIV